MSNGTEPVQLIVSRRGIDHSSALLPEPTLQLLADVLADLFERLGCETPGREVTAEVQRGDGRIRLYAKDPEASAEEVAEELWKRIVERSWEDSSQPDSSSIDFRRVKPEYS